MKTFAATTVLFILAALLAGATARGAQPTATSITVGERYACALTSAGGVKCWGFNGWGMLGDGTTTNRSTPVDVSGLTSGVQAVSAGIDHACALTTGGAVKCWGRNDLGQLGDGTTTDRSTPVDVSGLGSGVAAISAGGYHSCAVTTAGAAKCWGRNSFGQLGNGSTTNSSVPVSVIAVIGPPITFLSGVTAISAGGNHTCAITAGSKLWCWGDNSLGTVGDGTTTERHTAVQLSGFWSAVSAGNSHTCAITVDLVDPTAHGVRCWGDNFSGAIGDGTQTTRTSPTDVFGLGSSSKVKAVSAGSGHTCVVTSTDGAKCWGANGAGGLGDGTTTTKYAPGDVSGLTSGVTAIVAGYDTCAIVSTGELKCWGGNDQGQLGNGTAVANSTTPVLVSGIGAKTLTVTTAGTGSGTVTSGPAGINCGSGCTADYANGTSVTLTASASPGSTFAGWSGDCSGTSVQCTLTMSADHSASATFSLPATTTAPTTTTTATTTTNATTTTATPSTPPPTTTNATTTPAAPSTPPPAATAVCIVPNVVRKALAAALTAITKAHCTSGSVKLGRSSTVAKGLVIWQSPKAGTKPKSGKVSLLVSSGR